jgi:hypothetical protein
MQDEWQLSTTVFVWLCSSLTPFFLFARQTTPVYTCCQQKMRHLAVQEHYKVANLQTEVTSLAAETIVSTLRNAIKFTATLTNATLTTGRVGRWPFSVPPHEDSA